MGVGLGLGFLTASNDSSLTATFGPLSESWNYKPSVSVIPITVSFHYSLPLGRVFSAHFSAGPGLYISSFKFEDRYVMPLLFTDVTETFTPSTKVFFGAQASAGMEFALSPHVSLTLDVLGRLANMVNLAGTHTFAGTLFGITGSLSFNNHMFYYYEEGTNAFYAIQANMPSGAGIVNAREASVSLSGICAMVGIKINL